MRAKRRRTAFALAALAAAALLMGPALSAAHGAHDCIGEACPLCRQIAACTRIARLLCAAVTAVFFSTVQSHARRMLCRAAPAFAPRTPVSLGVKLSD